MADEAKTTDSTTASDEEKTEAQPVEDAESADESTDQPEETDASATEETEEAPEEEKEEVVEKPIGEISVDEIEPGMTIRVHEKITDVDPRGEKRERTQMFQGIVLGLRGSGVSKTMMIRKVLKGYGVEKIFPINSPIIQKVELVKTANVRRAKLNYLKDKKRRFKRKLKETWAERQ